MQSPCAAPSSLLLSRHLPFFLVFFVKAPGGSTPTRMPPLLLVASVASCMPGWSISHVTVSHARSWIGKQNADFGFARTSLVQGWLSLSKAEHEYAMMRFVVREQGVASVGKIVSAADLPHDAEEACFQIIGSSPRLNVDWEGLEGRWLLAAMYHLL